LTDGEFQNTKAAFPDIVGKVLSDLKSFPNLRTVTFEFPFEWGEWEQPWTWLYVPESPYEIRIAEEDEGWRALMLKSFDALSKNTTSSIEEFEIKRLVAKEVSAFTSKDFRDFLGKLKTFSVSLHDWFEGMALVEERQLSFEAFAEKLGNYFFDHLQSTTDFSLKADRITLLCMGSSVHHVHLALRPSQFPLLRKLALRCIHICPELADFLIAHLGTLEELVMTHCQCLLPLLDEDTEVMRWYEFLDALTEKQPPRLRKLEMTPARQIGEESLDEFDDERRYRGLCEFLEVEPERGLCKKTRELQVEDPKRRLFTYANYDEDGRLTRDAKEELESLLKGEDQRAYDRLMAIVERNRENGNMPTSPDA
jgi:hypothetical protein